MSRWSHAICERCWIEQKAVWQELANGIKELVEVRKPVLVQDPHVERCCFCDHLTIMGIYTRHDPAELGCDHE